MATHFEFILSDPVSDPKPGKSLQIRRRCMQGKNKREDSRRSKRDKKRLAKEESVTANIPQRADATILPLWSFVRDRTVASFAASAMDHEDKDLLLNAFAYNVTNQDLSPLDRALDLDCIESASFEWLFSDTAYLHSILCARHAANDFTSPTWDGQPGTKTVFHLRKTLSLLQDKMSDELVLQDESILYIVINLALLSAVYGDWQAASAHFSGLHRIVHLKGYTRFLRARPSLHFKIDRLDLLWSLSSGKSPFFATSTVSWDSIMSAPYYPLPKYLLIPPEDWDFRLLNLFRDFQFLSLRVNQNSLRYARHRPALFQEVLASFQSRLLNLRGMLSNPLEELIRLSLLAFMTTTFRVTGRKVPYNWAQKRLQSAYMQVCKKHLESENSLHLWILMTAALTVTGPDAGWVRTEWQIAADGLDWKSVRSKLVSVTWMDIMHESAGRKIFQELSGTTMQI